MEGLGGEPQEMIVLSATEMGVLEPLDGKSACVWAPRHRPGWVRWVLATGGA